MDQSVPSQRDPEFYKNGAKKMIAEGMEAVSKIMAFIKQNEGRFRDMNIRDRKKEILSFEPSQLFNQVHPIVFQYMIEGVFNASAFKRYVTSVYGKPKRTEDLERMRQDRRFVYHYKNAQYALYYKYLLIETNPNVRIDGIQKMYDEMVNQLNADTDAMLDMYEKAEAESKIKESEITNEKREDLLKVLRKQFSSN